MAQSKEVIDQAYPGDIIGLHDTGDLRIGDTITEGESFSFKGIPSFSPEIFKVVINEDHENKAVGQRLLQLCEEGVAQLFIRPDGSRKIIGTVGALQFEVIQYRLANEYGAKCRFEPLNFIKACWVTAEDDDTLHSFIKSRPTQIAKDTENRTVYLAETQWSLDREIKEHPNLTFHTTSE